MGHRAIFAAIASADGVGQGDSKRKSKRSRPLDLGIDLFCEHTSNTRKVCTFQRADIIHQVVHHIDLHQCLTQLGLVRDSARAVEPHCNVPLQVQVIIGIGFVLPKECSPNGNVHSLEAVKVLLQVGAMELASADGQSITV